MHKFELAGVHAGKTVNLGGFQFVEGVYHHDSADQTVEGLTTYLERAYYAFPAGSDELKAAQERYEREQESGMTETGEGELGADEAAGSEQPSATIKEAIDSLDHANDEHWTEAGLPSLDAVSDFAGERVTRAQVEASAPGYNRAAAKAAADI